MIQTDLLESAILEELAQGGSCTIETLYDKVPLLLKEPGAIRGGQAHAARQPHLHICSSITLPPLARTGSLPGRRLWATAES